MPNCKIVARVDREVFSPDGTLKSLDTRFFISSLDPKLTTPEKLLQLIRDHWQVENCLHWQKDRWWDEDRHYLKSCGVVFIALTNFALSLLRLLLPSGLSLRQTAEDVHFNPKNALRTLGWG